MVKVNTGVIFPNGESIRQQYKQNIMAKIDHVIKPGYDYDLIGCGDDETVTLAKYEKSLIVDSVPIGDDNDRFIISLCGQESDIIPKEKIVLNNEKKKIRLGLSARKMTHKKLQELIQKIQLKLPNKPFIMGLNLTDITVTEKVGLDIFNNHIFPFLTDYGCTITSFKITTNQTDPS